jgi:PST family polysaccharide transporter
MLSQLNKAIKELRPIREIDYIGVHRTRSLARVGSITVVEQVFKAVLQFISIVILSRLLPVSAFGLIAMVGFFQLLLQTIGGSGIIESIIQVKNLQPNEVAGIFWINCGMGLILGGGLALSGPLIASFNNEPQLVSIAVAMGGLFFLQNIPQTQNALLRRSMRAETQSVINILTSLMSLLATVSFAVYGWGVWSILAGNLVSLTVRQALLSYYVRFCPWKRFSFLQIKPMLSYGLKATFGSVVGFLTLNIQTLALGKYASSADVGFYNRAQNLYQRPLKQLVWPLVGAALPAMSALQGNGEKLLGLVNRATWLLNFALAPFAILMIVSGDLVVGLLLGEEWRVTGEVIRWVAIAQVPLLFNTPLTRANAAIGRPARSVWLNVLLLPVILTGVTYYAAEGVVAVAIFLMVVRLSTYPIFLYLNLRNSGMSSKVYLRSLFPLFCFIIVASIVGLYCRNLCEYSDLWKTLLLVFTTFTSSLVCLYLFYRKHPIGIEVLRWVFSRFGSRFLFLNLLIP